MSNYYDEQLNQELFRKWGSLTRQEEAIWYDQHLRLTKAIIFTHQFLKWGCPFEELVSEGIEALTKAFPKYNPEFITTKGVKATLFNYCSLTVKRCLIFYTTKQNTKNVKTEELFDIFAYSDPTLYSDRYEVLRKFLMRKVEIQPGHGAKYIEYFRRQVDILIKMLPEGGESRRAISSRIIKQGIPGTAWRDFADIMRKYKDEIIEIMSQDNI